MRNELLENEIKTKLLKLTRDIEIIEDSNFIGAYLHGSLAMDCFNPESSDIDFLIVVRDKLTEEQKEKIGNLVIGYQKDLSNKLEISVVTLSTIKDIKYPPQYELYFPDENGGYKKDGVDANLVTDFAIIKKYGIVISGEPIDKLFSIVPDRFYLEAIIKDFEWSFHNVIEGEDEGEVKIPVYAVLNFCRVLVFFRDRLVISKKEGGVWGLKNLPQEYNLLIEEALKEYAEKRSSSFVSAKLLKDFARYVQTELQLDK